MKIEGGNVIEIDREAKGVTIPPTATRICEVACFFGLIKSLDLENTQITIIEKHAFANCYKLEEVRFPSCLEEIGEGAFKKCKNLRNISFPQDSRLRIIGNKAFIYCSLKYFCFPHLLEFIGDYSFYGSYFDLRIIDLRETKVRHVGRNSFKYAANVYFPSTVAPDDIMSISDNCKDDKCHIEVDESHPVIQRDSCGYFFANGTIFHGNKGSRRVLIRRGVERIAGRCFSGSKLVSVTIPSSVTEISDFAFCECERLQHIRFTKDSRLRVIGRLAFCLCCSLERVIFPQDSRLERIEWAFYKTAIKRLSLPPSVREIVGVSFGMEKLESMFVSNEYYQSNEEGSAIFSRDGSELVCVIKTLKQFKIPDGVRAIKKKAFYQSSITSIIIPPSVEVIEEEAFFYCSNFSIIEFEEGSRLKSLAFDAFGKLDDLIINNENFITMGNGVVMSLNPMGIVFVPRHSNKHEIPPGVEVIYSYAFSRSEVKSLKFPKSLKKIFSCAFYGSSIESVTFEEGTELDFIGNSAFYNSNIESLKLPNIKGDLDYYSLDFGGKDIVFPQNLCLRDKELYIFAENIVCPLSSLPVVAHFNYNNRSPNFVNQESLSQDFNHLNDNDDFNNLNDNDDSSSLLWRLFRFVKNIFAMFSPFSS